MPTVNLERKACCRVLVEKLWREHSTTREVGPAVLTAVGGAERVPEIKNLSVSLTEADINWLSDVAWESWVCRLAVLPNDLVNEG
jgi:hypothetical protein